MVLAVLGILSVCVLGSLHCVYGQISLRSPLFCTVLILGVFQAVLFEYCICF